MSSLALSMPLNKSNSSISSCRCCSSQFDKILTSLKIAGSGRVLVSREYWTKSSCEPKLPGCWTELHRTILSSSSDEECRAVSKYSLWSRARNRAHAHLPKKLFWRSFFFVSGDDELNDDVRRITELRFSACRLNRGGVCVGKQACACDSRGFENVPSTCASFSSRGCLG